MAKSGFSFSNQSILFVRFGWCRSTLSWLGYGIAHGCIGFDVFHAVIVHDTQVAFAECFGHRFRHFGFGFDNFFARISCDLAFISCSEAMATARRSSALAWAMFLSASAWSICNLFDIYLYQCRQYRWREFQRLYRHPVLCEAPVWRLSLNHILNI